MFFLIPVTITSVRFVPNMKLLNLPAGASLPLPYDGNGSSAGHSVISYIILLIQYSKKQSK